MPFCPECRYEYVEGMKTCPDCNVELVDQRPEEPKERWDDLEFVTVATFYFPMDADMAKLRLDLEGIESALVGAIIARVSRPETGFQPIKLMVRAEDAGRARRILERKTE